jgi:hypothetical protein
MAEPDEAEDKIEIVIHVNMQKEVIKICLKHYS